MRRLLQLPQVFTESGHRCGRIKHDFRPVKSERPCPLGKMPIITNVNPDLSHRSLEYRISQVPWSKIKLLPKSWSTMRNMVLSILAQVGSIRVDHRGGVVIDAGKIFLVDRHDQDHPESLRRLAHQVDRISARNFFGDAVPPHRLLGAKIRPVKQFLHAEDLDPAFCRVLDHRHVLFSHRRGDFLWVSGARMRHLRLNEPRANNSCHDLPPTTVFGSPIISNSHESDSRFHCCANSDR